MECGFVEESATLAFVFEPRGAGEESGDGKESCGQGNEPYGTNSPRETGSSNKVIKHDNVDHTA